MVSLDLAPSRNACNGYKLSYNSEDTSQDRAFNKINSARLVCGFSMDRAILDWFFYGQPVFVWTGFLPDVLLTTTVPLAKANAENLDS